MIPFALILLALAPLPAQQRPARAALRHDAAAWVPTAEGTQWSYRRTTVDQNTGARGETRIGKGVFGTYRRPDGGRWHLVGVHDGRKDGHFEHWNTEGPGLLVQTSDTAAGAPDGDGRCPLAAPVGAVNRWAWQERDAKRTTELRATVVAFEESVAVPAGTFLAVRVRIDEFDVEAAEPERTATGDWWFAREAGLVRHERTAGDLHEVTELLTVARGRDQAPERLATLQMLAPPAWLWGARGTAAIRWLDADAGSVAFGGRFAVIGDGAAAQLAFVRPGAFVPLAATGKVGWQEIVRGGGHRDLALVALTAARAHAARLGLAEVAVESDGHGRATARWRDAGGDRSFTAVVENAAPLAVEIREAPAKR